MQGLQERPRVYKRKSGLFCFCIKYPLQSFYPVDLRLRIVDKCAAKSDIANMRKETVAQQRCANPLLCCVRWDRNTSITFLEHPQSLEWSLCRLQSTLR